MPFKFFSITLLVFVIFVTNSTFAITPQDATKLLQPAAEKAGFQPTSIPFPVVVGNYIGVFSGIVGILALIVVVYAGYLWMTAGGNDEKVTKAKTLMRNGVIGLVIISMAYTLTQFAIRAIIGEEVGPGEVVQQPTAAPGAPATPGAAPAPEQPGFASRFIERFLQTLRGEPQQPSGSLIELIVPPPPP